MPTSTPVAVPAFQLSAYYFFYFAFVGVFSPYFGLYLQSLHFSAWDIGLLMSQMQLMRLLGPYLWGILADRRQQRVPIVQVAGAISLLGFSAFFWFKTLPGMLLAMAVLSFFWSAALPLVETLTFDHLRDQPGRYSHIRLWGSIGFIITVLGAGWLLDRLAPDSVLWMCWLVLLGILLLAFAIPEPPARCDSKSDTGDISSLLAQPRVRALFAACFAMSAAHGALYTFYSIHLTDHHYSKSAVGLLWSLGVMAEIVVFLLMSRLSRRYSLRSLLLATFLAATLRFLLIGWCIEALLVTLFAQVLHGLTFGAFHAAAIATVNRWFTGRCQARGQALYSSLSFGAGGLFGGLIAGWTWDAWGADWTYTLSSAYAAIGGFLIWRWVREAPETD